MKSDVVSIKNIDYKYNNLPVLIDVCMDIKNGDFIGLIGPNGSGKTTLLKLILGLIPVQKGEIYLFDKPVSKFHDWHKIGYVSQKANSFNSGFPATVFEVVSMGLYGQKGLFRHLNKKDKEKIYEVIDIVGLSDYVKSSIGKLSGGQQQRVFIARALVSKPQLLILDEPTVGVDIESSNQFYYLLEKMNKEMGITIVFVSHDINVLTKKVSIVACLNKEIYFHGPPEDYRKQTNSVLEGMYGNDMGIVNHNDRLMEE